MKEISISIVCLLILKLVEAFSPIKHNYFHSSLLHKSIFTDKDIFYPTTAISLDGLSEDEVLHDLFLRQFVGEEIETKSFHDSNQSIRDFTTGLSIKNNKNTKNINNKRIVEVPIHVVVDTPLEIIHKNRVCFGNYISKKVNKDGLLSSSAVLIRLVSGEIITIDISQIISCWDQLADHGVPKNSVDWAQVTGDALEILGKT